MAQPRKGNRELIRGINRNLILNLIRSRGPISRAELARESGLSAATVSGIANDFLQKGLVAATGQGESTGGRRPTMLQLVPEAGFVIGAKVMERQVATALTDLGANVLHHAVHPFHLADDSEQTTPEELLGALTRAIEQTITDSGVVRSRLLGIGIGLAGLVDSESGSSSYSPFFHWERVPIAEPLREHFALPVYLENDVNTLTIAEQWFGYGQEAEHFLVITVGRGIGAGLVMNGRFYRGQLGGAGEVGHMTLIPGGPLCDCGKRGCLEALASDEAILREVRKRVGAGDPSSINAGEGLSLQQVIDAALAGDHLATDVLSRAGTMLGIGIANLVNALNPELVIVGGEGVHAGESRLNAMRQAIQDHAFDGLADHLRIVIEPAGDDTWARGAACLVLGELFRSPVEGSAARSLMEAMA